jgi:ankyrin repeat protein
MACSLQPVFRILIVGRFRWVQCQLDTLRQCLKPSAVLMTLSTLPEGLDATYARILSQIPKLYHQEAQIVFALLISARRAISLGEAAEAAAIDLQTHSFDKRNRLRHPESVLKICSSFLSLSPFKPKVTEWASLELATTDSQKEVRFAHYSVEEYLISERAPNGFGLTKDDSHAIVARITLGYLLSISTSILPGPATLEYFPLLLYAASHWFAHANVTHVNSYRDVHQLVLRFFRPENIDQLKLAVGICDPDTLFGYHMRGLSFASRLYYASLLGFVNACREICEEGPDVNAQGGSYGNALQAASLNGHREVVEMLLAKGADVNVQGGYHGNALQAASLNGNREVGEMLLAKGADVNAQGGYHDNALQAASFNGHREVVEMLLAKGADVNAQGGYYDKALQAASLNGHREVVEMLLAKGADVNAQGGQLGNALQAASFNGHREVVEMLLAKGADVNAQGGRIGNALQVASHSGHREVVEMLLAKGADVSAQGGQFGNALQAASRSLDSDYSL